MEPRDKSKVYKNRVTRSSRKYRRLTYKTPRDYERYLTGERETRVRSSDRDLGYRTPESFSRIRPCKMTFLTAWKS